MQFDWIEFLTKYNIPYRTDGPNCARGHVVIHCPFCGEADPSEHMGVCLDKHNPVWGCWRSTDHRGKNPIRLVKALLNCSWETAQDIVGIVSLPDRTEFDTVISKLLKREPKKVVQPPKPLQIPKTFRLIDGRVAAQRYLLYLGHRGFFDDAEDVARYYNLYYTVSDPVWKDRVILPVYVNDQLVSWTGRSIHRDADLRYKTLSREDGGVSLKHVVYEPPTGFGNAKWLIVTEGPLDMMKLDYYGKDWGVRATCLFGVGYTEEQLYLVASLASKFERVGVMFDPDAYKESLKFASELSAMKVAVEVLPVPDGVEDPGDLDNVDAEALARQIASA